MSRTCSFRGLAVGFDRRHLPGTITPARSLGNTMSTVVYEVVEHDGGWAYKLGAVFSETYPTHAAATAAAKRAAAEQRVPGRTEVIQFEDEKGQWHEETARGDDRPATRVVDKG